MAQVRPWMWWALGGAVLLGVGRGASAFLEARYPPKSQKLTDLMAFAALQAGLPVQWATDPDLHELVRKESGGWVGKPNYFYQPRSLNPATWPAIWDELRRGIYSARNKGGGVQSATGLGQLQYANVDRDYPAGRAGIGDAFNEAVGMLRYIKRRYGNPSKALAFHLAHNSY